MIINATHTTSMGCDGQFYCHMKITFNKTKSMTLSTESLIFTLDHQSRQFISFSQNIYFLNGDSNSDKLSWLSQAHTHSPVAITHCVACLAIAGEQRLLANRPFPCLAITNTASDENLPRGDPLKLTLANHFHVSVLVLLFLTYHVFTIKYLKNEKLVYCNINNNTL